MIHYMTTRGIGNAWVGNELRILQREKIPFRLHSLVRPETSYFLSPEFTEIAEQTNVIYPLGMSAIFSLLAAPWLFGARFWSALWNAVTGPRESTWLRLKVLWHLIVACDWARRQRHERISLIHSQWINSSGTVAMYGAWLLDKPFSFTGHAADLFRGRVALADKIERASQIVCISQFHRSFYLEHGARPEQLRIAYCGIDSSHFVPPAHPRLKDGTLHLLSSGRLVEKKGFRYVIEACRILIDRGVQIRCTIAGSGPLEGELRGRVQSLGLEDEIRITGEPLMQEEIPEFMHQGDIYCLPCVWASDNDVDGLPQMLMEAMASELPVVSTRLVGIPDLVIHEKTGLLAQPGNATELADCIQRVWDDPDLSTRLAKSGRQHVIANFDLVGCLKPLTEYFESQLVAA